MDIERQAVRRDPLTGSQEVVHTQEHVPSVAAVQGARIDRTNSYVWYVVAVIEILLLLRVAFLVLGAHNTGFASLLYSLTYPFVVLFKGIFASPTSDTGYLETASILAMLAYALIGWAIVSLLDISKRGRTAA
jgi:uncharacterized integral membrane protein